MVAFAVIGWTLALLLLAIVAWQVYCLDVSKRENDELRLELAREQAGRAVLRVVGGRAR